jgi:exopolysaccharide biosynthesis polyprenyl glycosylphosphotransferase
MFISTRKPITVNKLRLILIDSFSLILAMYLATLLRLGANGANEYIASKVIPLSGGLFIFLILFYLQGLYELRMLNNYFKVISKVVLSVFFGILSYTFIFYAVFSFAIGRGVFTLMALFIIIFTLIPRLFYITIAKRNMLDQKIVIIGSGQAATDIISFLNGHPLSLYEILGIVSETENQNAVEINGHKYLGSIDQISEIIKHKKVDALLVTTLEPKRSKILKHLRACRYHGVGIIDIVSLYEELEGRVPLQYIDDEWLFSSTMNYPSFHTKKLKRLVDLAGASLGIILTFPMCVIVAILIKLDSKGPVFYRQKRLGRDSRAFRVIKFRSMIHRAEKGLGGPVWSSKEDPRITKAGKWLRKTRIDEIPQLINVFLGHMSLVGPRPERPAFIRELSEKIPFYQERLYVQPGLTGWAQINYPYAATVEESKIKLQYDLYYIKHVSFFLDSLIILKTLKIVLLGHGR